MLVHARMLPFLALGFLNSMVRFGSRSHLHIMCIFVLVLHFNNVLLVYYVARAREDTEKIDRGVKRKAERLHHIATVCLSSFTYAHLLNILLAMFSLSFLIWFMSIDIKKHS